MEDCNMKKILLISNIYPTGNPQYGGTSVCHYFTCEWMRLGYDVRVIHFDSLFPKPYYWVGRAFNSLIQAKTGCVVNVDTSAVSQEYVIDGIPVLFVPLRKFIPHRMFSQKEMNKALGVVCDYLNKYSFIPDVVVGHFVLPQLQFLHMLKKRFPQVKTTMVIHSDGSNIKTVYGDRYKEYMDSVDVWGFRSVAFKKRFESLYGIQKNEFLCYSGIPEKYIQPVSRTFKSGVTNFTFVGSLYKLKRIEDTIRALNKSYGKEKFHFDIVGNGSEETNLKKLVSALGIKEKVVFHGKKTRDEALTIMEQSDCFIMVSAHEAFGLVYVEAMAKGCITVATAGQGIDGVIVDGKNGFLCVSQNVEELAKVINKIRNLPVPELNRISKNAMDTAAQLTNRKVAEMYINASLNC